MSRLEHLLNYSGRFQFIWNDIFSPFLSYLLIDLFIYLFIYLFFIYLFSIGSFKIQKIIFIF